MQKLVEDLLDPGERLVWSGRPVRDSRIAKFERDFLVGGWAMTAMAIFFTLQFWVVGNPDYWDANRAVTGSIAAPVCVLLFGFGCLFSEL